MIEKRTDEGPGSCPSEERFLDFFLGKDRGPEEEAILDHIDGCPDCRIKFGLLRDLDPILEEQTRRLRPLAEASRRELRGHLRAAGKFGSAGRIRALAAAGIPVIAVAIIAVLFVFRPLRNDSVERGKIADAYSLPNGRVAEAPRLYVWGPMPGAESYRFELIEENLRPIAETDSLENWILLPASVQKEIKPGRTFIWTVEAYDDEGMKVGEITRYFHTK